MSTSGWSWLSRATMSGSGGGGIEPFAGHERAAHGGRDPGRLVLRGGRTHHRHAHPVGHAGISLMILAWTLSATYRERRGRGRRTHPAYPPTGRAIPGPRAHRSAARSGSARTPRSATARAPGPTHVQSDRCAPTRGVSLVSRRAGAAAGSVDVAVLGLVRARQPGVGYLRELLGGDRLRLLARHHRHLGTRAHLRIQMRPASRSRRAR